MHKPIDSAPPSEKPARKKLSIVDLGRVSGGRLPDGGTKFEVSDGGYSVKYES